MAIRAAEWKWPTISIPFANFSVEQEDIASVIFASSIGSMFNKLFTQASKYRYAKIA